MKIVTLDSQYWSQVEAGEICRQDLEDIIKDYVLEASKKLGQKFEHLNVVIEPVDSDQTIPETGVMGMAYSPGYVSITFDYSLPYGVDAMKSNLRTTVHHELVHAYTFSHDPWRPSALFGAISEGLANVFERDHAAGNPLWAKYEDDETMHNWYRELKQLPESQIKDTRYFFDHPDGRRWIVYKTGTWIIDSLIKSGSDLFKLMAITHTEILAKFENLHEPKASA